MQPCHLQPAMAGADLGEGPPHPQFQNMALYLLITCKLSKEFRKIYVHTWEQNCLGMVRYCPPLQKNPGSHPVQSWILRGVVAS